MVTDGTGTASRVTTSFGIILLVFGVVSLAGCGPNFSGYGKRKGHHGKRMMTSDTASDTRVRTGRKLRRKKHRKRRRMRRRRRAGSSSRPGPWTTMPSPTESEDEGSDGIDDRDSSDAEQGDDDTVPESEERLSLGRQTYDENCASCHGEDRGGSLFSYPSLKDVSERLTRDEIRTVIESGPGRMPSFDQLSDEQIDGLLEFLQK
jgi:hypothetical protein